jgi:hypothetical protein
MASLWGNDNDPWSSYPRPRRVKTWIAWIIILSCLGLAIWAATADANGRYGSNSDRISDRPLTVREIEDRADINWAFSAAERWAEEDESACTKEVEFPGGHYAMRKWIACMMERQNARILYMLRRGCVGGHGISEICDIPLGGE